MDFLLIVPYKYSIHTNNIQGT